MKFVSVSLALPTLLLGSVASAQFFRADGATTTSSFSSGYVAANAINGSGLPAGFGPLDTHAIYASGNHWTTANGHTIGESATFTFNQPRTVGGFYMWAHRSNGIANNPYYAVTRFDLIFRNSGGATLATLSNLVGIPDIQAAQTYSFNQIANVSSVQFIVRATANNNVSPYTGLAEVAFDTCIQPLSNPPESVRICPDGTATMSVSPIGSGPLTYAWTFNGNPIDPLANPTAATANLQLNGISANVGAYRCIITNPCGTFTTGPATLAVCASDFNCDGAVDFFDYLDFVDAFSSNLPSADFNHDTTIDFFDYLDFVDAFSSGC